jgi:hypothetical protein
MADMFDKEELGIVGSLFGMSPAMQNKAMQQAAYKRGTEAGQNLLGGVLGNVGMFSEAAGQGLRGGLGVQSPEERMMGIRQQAQQQFDTNTPEGLLQMADFLNQQGDAAGARQAVMLAQGQQARTQGIATSRATEQARLREKVPSAEEQANRTRLEDLINQFGPVEGANKFRQEQLEGRKSVSAAGVPQPGMVNVTDLKGAKSIVDDYTKAPREKLKAVGEIGVLINQISTNPTALPQLQRSLVKLAGDSQIGQNEVKNILGSSGFTADVIDGVNKFLTGAPTNAKIQDVARGVKAIEQFYANQYEQGRETSKRVLGNAKLDARTIDDLVPKAYSMGKQAPIYAVNPQTKERIMSTDGGKTWTPSK